MARDLHVFLRRCAKSPSTIVVVAILGAAIGIVSTTTVLIERLVLRPLPFPDQERLLALSGLSYAPATGVTIDLWHVEALQALAVYRSGSVAVGTRSEESWVSAAIVTPQFLSVLGVTPTQGRDFRREDQRPDGPVMVSDSLWRGRLAGRPLSDGLSLRVGGRVRTVVGVIPAGFAFPSDATIWLPYVDTPDLWESVGAVRVGGGGLQWIGRLERTATLDQARAQVTAVLAHLNQTFSPVTGVTYGDRASVTLLRDRYTAGLRSALGALWAAAVAVLLLASTNCTLFLLGRNVARRGEDALHLSLGASPRRLAQQRVVEAIAMAVLAAVCGYVIAVWLGRVAEVFVTESGFGFVADRSFLGHLAVHGVVTILGVGLPTLASMMDVRRGPVLMSVNERVVSRTAGTGAWRRGLVGVQVCLAVVLTIGAVLSLRTVSNLTTVDPGVELDQVLSVTVTSRRTTDVRDILVAEQQQVLSTLEESIPGMGAVALATALPVVTDTHGYQEIRAQDDASMAVTMEVSDAYFTVVGTPLVAGRSVRASEPGTVVVSRRLAGALWPGRSAVGQQVTIGGESTPRQVVGVAGDVEPFDMSERASPSRRAVYVPLGSLAGTQPGPAFLLVRCVDRCAATLAQVVEQVRAAGTMVIRETGPLERAVSSLVQPAQRRAVVLSVFMVFGLVLAWLGVYVLTAHVTKTRRREMAIRQALGAHPIHVITLIARQEFLAAGVGAVVGCGLAMGGGTRLLRTLVFGVTPLDPFSYVSSTSLVVCGVLAAAALPILSVLRESPQQVLQEG